MAISKVPLGIRLIRATAEPVVRVRFYNVSDFDGRLATLAMVDEVAPMIAEKFEGKVEVSMFLVPQPWHPQAGLLAEVVLACEQVAGEAAARDLIVNMYRNRETFIDENILDLTRKEIYDLAATEAEKVGGDKSKIMELLELVPTGGTGVTKALKRYVKHHRTFSIHVTPTAVVNDLVANEVSSSWGVPEWDEFLSNLLKEE